VALLASAKLEDGDVKGAVRLLGLCCDDKLVTPDTFTFNQLSHLHPRNPADRPPTPTSDAPHSESCQKQLKLQFNQFPVGH